MKSSIRSAAILFLLVVHLPLLAQEAAVKPATEPPPVDPPHEKLDEFAKMQYWATRDGKADWGHWGTNPASYSSWTSHSNRLIPVYIFGDSFDLYQESNSLYRDPSAIQQRFGRIPENCFNERADYGDQTDIYRLQRSAMESGRKKYVFLIVFDGMDWQTTWAAACYRSQGVPYTEGRGNGLLFQDYRVATTDFGFFVSSPFMDDCKTDQDLQQIKVPAVLRGGYDARLGGSFPWSAPLDIEYPIGKSKGNLHAVTDSSSSATSMTSGIKTFDGAVNMTPDCKKTEPIAQWAQRTLGMKVGAVTSVPISHATPAAAYANNVSRDDYQDLTRDMLGLPSCSHPAQPLHGMDVVIGTGWGIKAEKAEVQGKNFVPGNVYLTEQDQKSIDVANGGKYQLALRTSGEDGNTLLARQATEAAKNNQRLFGYFGTGAGHLPFQTANGDYLPTRDVKGIEKYTPEDLKENPTLATMAQAAIQVLETSPNGFWLMIESGDVDWANHSNNIDNSIGAVFSGDAAFEKVVRWIESKNAWNESLIILTADHGHYFHLTAPEKLLKAKG